MKMYLQTGHWDWLKYIDLTEQAMYTQIVSTVFGNKNICSLWVSSNASIIQLEGSALAKWQNVILFA